MSKGNAGSSPVASTKPWDHDWWKTRVCYYAGQACFASGGVVVWWSLPWALGFMAAGCSCVVLLELVSRHILRRAEREIAQMQADIDAMERSIDQGP